MQAPKTWSSFFLQEWLLLAAAAGFVVTSVYRKTVPFLSGSELEVLFILLALFVSVKGLERSGLTGYLARHLERGKHIPLKLVGITFLLAMLVTNDVALVLLVPLTMTLRTGRKDWLVILEALAANAGSALTPIGNPQNLFLYWYYHLPLDQFFRTIAPFSLFFLVVLVLSAFAIRTSPARPETDRRHIRAKFWPIYTGFFVVLVGMVLRVLPIWFGCGVLLFAVLFDRKSLAIDYSLLLTFLFFFLFAENLKFILGTRLEHPEHIFLLSALLSQFISNVPATLILVKFTAQWQALLWGTNVGGFGSLVGSLANLIAYRIYVTHENGERPARFTVRFLMAGFAAFFAGLALFFFWMG